jgi:biotin carboxyl carrier protein
MKKINGMIQNVNLSNVKALIFKLFLIAIISGCSPKAEEPENNGEAKTPVTLTSIAVQSLSESFELNAVSTFLKRNIVKSTTTGFVTNVGINPGENVENGQLLFTLKTKEASAIDKNVSTDSLLAFQGLIKITAPKSGVISSVSHQKGDYIQEGDELATISEQASLVYLLQVPFEMRGYIHKNMQCEIIFPDKNLIEGTISTNMPSMDIASQTESFVVKPNVLEKQLENLIVKVRIIKTSKTHAFVLPKAAVLANEEQSEFWVMKLINDSTAVKVIIKKGIETSDKVEILGPVFNKTDRIILSGQYGLPDTARVLIQLQN